MFKTTAMFEYSENIGKRQSKNAGELTLSDPEQSVASGCYRGGLLSTIGACGTLNRSIQSFKSPRLLTPARSIVASPG
jgi:hypothetical protein